LRQLLVDPPAARILLEEALPERTGALVGVLLRRDELGGDLGRTDRPAEPDAGKERLRRRARLAPDVVAQAGTTSGARLQRLGAASSSKPSSR